MVLYSFQLGGGILPEAWHGMTRERVRCILICECIHINIIIVQNYTKKYHDLVAVYVATSAYHE